MTPAAPRLFLCSALLCCLLAACAGAPAWTTRVALPTASITDWAPLWSCTPPADEAALCDHDPAVVRARCKVWLDTKTTRFTGARCLAFLDLRETRGRDLGTQRHQLTTSDTKALMDAPLGTIDRTLEDYRGERQRALESALQWLDMAHALAPDVPDVLGHILDVQLALRQEDAALTTATTLTTRFAKLTRVRQVLLRRLARWPQPHVVLPLLDQLADAAPEDVDVLLTRARLYVWQEQMAAALADAERARDLNPRPEVFDLLVRCYLLSANLKSALKVARQSPGGARDDATLSALAVVDMDAARRRVDALAVASRTHWQGALRQLDTAQRVEALGTAAEWTAAAKSLRPKVPMLALALALKAQTLAPRSLEAVWVHNDVLADAGLPVLRAALWERVLVRLGDAPPEGASLDQVRLLAVDALLGAARLDDAAKRLSQVRRRDAVFHFLSGRVAQARGQRGAARRAFEAVLKAPDAGALEDAARKALRAL